jgi:membrane protein
MTLLFAMIYKVIPRVRIRWRDVWIGAAVTAALFAVGKFLIGLYIGKAGVASPFGAAGSLVVLMVWVYYSAQIFLLGAEFTRIYAYQRGSRVGMTESANDDFVKPALRQVAPVRGHPFVKLGTALALGLAAGIGLKRWRR